MQPYLGTRKNSDIGLFIDELFVTLRKNIINILPLYRLNQLEPEHDSSKINSGLHILDIPTI